MCAPPLVAIDAIAKTHMFALGCATVAAGRITDRPGIRWLARPARRLPTVEPVVLPRRNHLQVAWAVVLLVAIFMVDKLIRSQLAPQYAFHDDAMFLLQLTVLIFHMVVARRVARSGVLRRLAAGRGAKANTRRLTAPHRKGHPTVPARLRHGGLCTLPCRETGARATAATQQLRRDKVAIAPEAGLGESVRSEWAILGEHCSPPNCDAMPQGVTSTTAAFSCPILPLLMRKNPTVELAVS